MKYIKLYKKIDSYLLKSEGVSDVINILGITPEIKEIHNIYTRDFLDNDKKMHLTINVFKFIEDKFNQMVAKYLKMSEVHILDQNYIEDRNLDLFLHDLIHEAIRPGSVKDFKEKNKLEELNYDKYNLQDFIDEDIASSLGNDASIFSGLAVYFSELSLRIMNDKHKTILTIDDLIENIKETLMADVGVIINKKQQQYVLYIARLLFNKLKTDNRAIYLTKQHIRKNDNAKFELSNLIRDYVADLNNEKLKTTTDTDKRKEKIINNELVASLLRRWLIYLKNNISNIKP